jgi:hypothetical protein
LKPESLICVRRTYRYRIREELGCGAGGNSARKNVRHDTIFAHAFAHSPSAKNGIAPLWQGSTDFP